MSEKNYTPVEAARKVLEKCQEMYNDSKIEKAEPKKNKDGGYRKLDRRTAIKINDSQERAQMEREKAEVKKEPVKKAQAIDKCGEMSKEEGMSVEEAVSAIMGEKHGVDDVMSKLPKEKRAKVLASLRSKDAKKAEFCKGWMEKAEKMDKCGEMSKGHDEAKESPSQEAKESSAVQAQEEKKEQKAPNLPKSENMDEEEDARQANEQYREKVAKPMSAVKEQVEKDKEMHPKLKRFIEKRKAKKAAKMEKMMGIGEKAPVAPPAQSAAPVNAPKPSIGAQIGFPGMKKKEKK